MLKKELEELVKEQKKEIRKLKKQIGIPEELNLEKIKKLKEFGSLERIKHPLLYLFIILISLPRILRIEVFGELSYSGDWPFNIKVENKILFLRYFMLLFSTAFWFYIWNTVSIVFGWNWNI